MSSWIDLDDAIFELADRLAGECGIGRDEFISMAVGFVCHLLATSPRLVKLVSAVFNDWRRRES